MTPDTFGPPPITLAPPVAPPSPTIGSQLVPDTFRPNIPSPISPRIPEGPITPYQPQTPPGPINQFGPGDNLIASQVNPVNRGDTESVRSAVMALLGQTSGGASRGDIAADTLKRFDEQQAESDRIAQQEIGRSAAKFGRLGSGVTTTQVGDYGERSAIARERERARLAGEVADQDIGDRFARVGAAQDVYGQFSGADVGARNEVRGERGYQAGLDQQALQNRIQQTGLEEDLYGNQFTRDQMYNQWLSQLGFPGSQNMLPGTADYYNEQAEGSNQSAADFFRLLAAQGGNRGAQTSGAGYYGQYGG
jgi:hypothetical protein